MSWGVGEGSGVNSQHSGTTWTRRERAECGAWAVILRLLLTTGPAYMLLTYPTVSLQPQLLLLMLISTSRCYILAWCYGEDRGGRRMLPS